MNKVNNEKNNKKFSKNIDKFLFIFGFLFLATSITFSITLAYYLNSDEYNDLARVAKFIVEGEEVINVDSSTLTIGQTITFGNYPQSEETDTTIKTNLNVLLTSTNPSSDSTGWTSYRYYVDSYQSDFMWYQDVSYLGDTYRAVYFNKYRPNTAIGNGTLDSSYVYDYYPNLNTIYWFKFEPISWIVTSYGDTEATLISTFAIDAQDYDIASSGELSSNNYEGSNIRSFLNNTFYDWAFNSLEKNFIKTTNVDNSATSTGDDTNTNACDNTNDKVYLLSNIEASYSNSSIFNSDITAEDTNREKEITDYAKVNGIISNGYTCLWMLRSPSSSDTTSIQIIGLDGEYYNNNNTCYYTWFGVVPAITIDLNKTLDVNDTSRNVNIPFSICNMKNNEVSEVSFSYDIEVIMPSVLPNGVDIYLDDNNNYTLSDDKLTYTFSNVGTFNANEYLKNYHLLCIKFTSYTRDIIGDYDYSSAIINVIAEQIT